MIPYGKQNLDASDEEAMLSVLRSDWLTQGPAVTAFEEAVAAYCGATYAVAVSSGTAALHVAYLAAGLGEGDEVITSPNTFVATSNMLLAVGAKPVFCDIDLTTHNIDETQIADLITPRTKAIVAVDFSGRPCAMDVIKKIAEQHNLIVITDGAHALGATWQGQTVGSIADMTTFSFHPVKPITTAEGGLVTTNNKEYYERLKRFRSHGIHKNADGQNVMTELGFNYRLPDVLAALGSSQLQKIDAFIAHRRQVAQWYKAALSDVSGVILPLPSAESGWHIYVIRTKAASDRMPLHKHLLEHGIGVNFHYPAVYQHPYYREHGYTDVNLPAMDEYHNTAITLPCHTLLQESDVRDISDCIKEYFHA